MHWCRQGATKGWLSGCRAHVMMHDACPNHTCLVRTMCRVLLAEWDALAHGRPTQRETKTCDSWARMAQGPIGRSDVSEYLNS